MQSSPVARLARQIKKMRQSNPPTLYRKICISLNIVKEDGQPDPGLAKLIEGGYEPRKESTRARLGLPPKARRRSYHPNEEYLLWWRNSLRSNQRRAFIKSIWEMNKKK